MPLCLALAVLYNAPSMILVVEDEDRARETFARMLKGAGYGVLEAADGPQAMSLLEKTRCDLVTSDILMPNLNGYALVARIRAKWPNLPTILTSGFLSQDAAHERLCRVHTQAH